MANNLDFLDELANYLQVLLIGTAGTNIFVNKQPADVDNCVCLFGLPGATAGAGRDVPGLQFPRYQAIIRNTSYNDGADKFQAVRTALHGLIGKILPNGVNIATTPYIRIMRSHAEQEGGPIGEDDKGRSEFSINFIAEYHHYDATP